MYVENHYFSTKLRAGNLVSNLASGVVLSFHSFFQSLPFPLLVRDVVIVVVVHTLFFLPYFLLLLPTVKLPLEMRHSVSGLPW